MEKDRPHIVKGAVCTEGHSTENASPYKERPSIERRALYAIRSPQAENARRSYFCIQRLGFNDIGRRRQMADERSGREG